MQAHPQPQAVRRLLLLSGVLALALPASADSTRQIAQELRSNRQALLDFTWKSRAETTRNGKTEEVQVWDVRYAMDGSLLATPADPEEPPTRRRGRSGAEPLAPELRSLVDGYTHLTPETLRELFGKATIRPGVGDDSRLIRVRAEGVLALGDRVEIWVDRESRRPRRSEVDTTLDGKPVRIETRFAELEGGPSFPAHTTVRTEVKARPLILEIENYEVALQGG